RSAPTSARSRMRRSPRPSRGCGRRWRRSVARPSRRNLPPNLAVLALVILALALRLWGIGWSLPNQEHLFSYHPDEGVNLVNGVLAALGRRLYGRVAGLLGAAFYAVAPLAVVHAHFATVDVTATFFVTLALVISARLSDAPGGARAAHLRAAAAAGLCCGLAAA